METITEKKIDIFIPIDLEKSFQKSDYADGGENWYVRGFASTPDLDMQGEIIQPSGIDIDYFKRHGWINYEHRQEPEYAIGAPTENSYVDFQKGLYVEAILFKDNPYAQEMWTLAQNIAKSGLDRNLGFSVEGAIRKRNAHNSKIIEELVIKNVSITKSPANPNATWEFFMKSFETGHEIDPAKQEDAGALRKEQLAQSINQLSYLYTITSGKEMEETWTYINKHLIDSKRYTPENATIMLQLARGLSRKEAEKYVHSKL